MVHFEHQTLSQRIADSLTTRLVEGDLKPGTRLTEASLVEEYGTSRAPIREALYILEKSGVVERQPRKGVFVKQYSKHEVREIYDVAYRLTEIALKKSVDCRTPEEIKTLKKYVEEMEQALERQNRKRIYLLVEDLHETLFHLSKNSILIDLYKTFSPKWTTYRLITLSHSNSLNRTVHEYRQVVAAIEEQDYEKAVNAMAEKEERVLRILDRIMD
ncbi:GntR family transcriptional regulator [Piscibacillus halophilus]|uniref:GntR family transcriptional regulator n=1 Tax=Piscibacillus halophilus TaxID=571933 RepID=UPI00240A2AF2|nr:GntR family transcriptional regulator [Piscibacillus halophilus]